MGKKEKKVNKENNENKDLEVIKKKERKFSRELLKKWLSRTSYTIIMTMGIIAICVGVNLLVQKLNISDIDLSTSKMYSLSESSKAVIKDINKEVKIVLINMQDNQMVIDFSNKYKKENKNIVVEEVNDIKQRPDLTSKYGLQDTDSAILIQSGSREQILSSNDIYTYDYTTGEEKSIIEESMTNALVDVSIDEKTKVYYLTGHEQYSTEYLYYFMEDLKNEANDVEDLDLLTKGKVPDDCATLMITSLRDDLKEVERDAILDYIKKGGKIAIFSDPNISKISLPNFQKVLDQYGVSISEGVMLEQDSSKMLADSPSVILADVNQSSSVTGSINMNMNVCFMNAGKLIFKTDEELEKLGVQTETLVTTSEKSFYRNDVTIQDTKKVAGEQEGSETVGALLVKKIDDDTSSKLIIYANNVFVSNIPIEVSSGYVMYALDFYNNGDLALNSIAYLTDRDDIIIVRKDTEQTSYTLTEQQKTIVLTIIFSIPVLIVIAGIIIWRMRRRKK